MRRGYYVGRFLYQHGPYLYKMARGMPPAMRMAGRKRGRDGEVKSFAFQARSGMTQRRKRRMGRKLKRPDPNLRYYIARWQNTSDSFTGPGRLRLGTWMPTGTELCMPVTFMSLTNCADLGDSHTGKGCNADVGLCRLYKKTSDGSYYWWPETCQPATGNLLGYDTYWKIEQTELEPPGQTNIRSIYHDWTDIRLNLYGTFSVPITYNVYIMQMPKELDPFSYTRGIANSAVAGTELYNFYKDVTRNLQGNSVNFNGRQDWPKDVRILRHDRVVLQPLSYSDQVAEKDGNNSSHTPNVHEYRLFIRHGRYRDYKWTENADDTIENEAFQLNQWDVNQPEKTMCDVEWGRRVVMFITCTCPDVGEPSPAGSSLADAVTARTQGSFDINVRNKFRFNW